MGDQLVKIEDGAGLKKFVKFQHELYRNHPNFVPPLIADEIDFLSSRNPVFEVVKQQLFIVERDGKVVGRISAHTHSLEQKKLGRKRGRFGWFDCIDDPQVARTLLDAAKHWLIAEGCVEMTGPHGFSDLDNEGLLIEGFNEVPTIAGSFHAPYHQKFVEDYGFQKEVDYLEYRFAFPDQEPKAFKRFREMQSPDYRVHVCKTTKELLKYVPSFWRALDDAFSHLYGVTPLTEKQQQYYTKKNFSLLDPKYIHFVLDKNDEVIGFFITMPNLSKAFQKAKGRLFPTGVFHLFRGMKKADTVDFLLAGVRSGHSSPLIATLMAISVYDACKAMGIKYCETNRELETNTDVTRIWSRFDPRQHRRSRMYRLPLG